MPTNTPSSRWVAFATGCLVAVAFCTFQAQAQPSAHANAAAGGLTQLNPGQPPVMIHPTVEMSRTARGNAKGSHGGGGGHGGHGGGGGGGSVGVNLYYHGGVGGIGVETAPRVYVVFWGSQWNGNDPSNEASILETFLSGVGGSPWANTNTQYCQNVPNGTVACGSSGQAAGNQTGFYSGTTMAWYDNATAAPSRPS